MWSFESDLTDSDFDKDTNLNFLMSMFYGFVVLRLLLNKYIK